MSATGLDLKTLESDLYKADHHVTRLNTIVSELDRRALLTEDDTITITRHDLNGLIAGLNENIDALKYFVDSLRWALEDED